MNRRRVTVNTARRMRDQADYLDLQIMSAGIYGNHELERALRRERASLRRAIAPDTGPPRRRRNDGLNRRDAASGR